MDVSSIYSKPSIITAQFLSELKNAPKSSIYANLASSGVDAFLGFELIKSMIALNRFTSKSGGIKALWNESP